MQMILLFASPTLHLKNKDCEEGKTDIQYFRGDVKVIFISEEGKLKENRFLCF